MRIIILALYMALFIVACGGSSAPSTNKEPVDQTKIVVFIDAPVKGLAYTSLPSGKKGITNEKGEFEYIDRDIVSFNMGSIELGNAIPGKDKNVKVTQLKEAILVAQLLQVLDTDADENKIDVSDIIIPEVVQEVIIEKLKRTENQAQDNIISKEQFEAIKQKNPKKLTLQQRPEVISKNKVLEHVKQQIGGSDIRFSASELKSLYLVEASLLNNFDGVAIGFSDEKSPAIQIDVKNNLVAKSISSEMSRSEWEIDTKGRLSLSSNGSTCKITKIAEDSYAMDVSYSCVDDLGLSRLVKPQPFSANDLSGKSFNFKSHGSNSRTITFGNDGSVNCDSEKSSCTYENHPIHKNAVWIKGGGNKGEDNTLMMLAQGSLAKGKLLIVHFDAQYNLDSVEVMKVSGNSLNPEFESVDNDHGNDDHNHNTDDNSDSKDNSESDKHNPAYIPFTQEMISGKTFYAVNEDNATPFVLGANKGEAWFDFVDSNRSPDVTFDYLIDSEGYIIFSNIIEKGEIADDTVAIGLLSKKNNALTTCWGNVSDISDFCKDDDISIWYKIKADAEAALKQREDNDRDENTDDNSGSNDNPNASTTNPTYIPFTQEMISGKTIFSVNSDGKRTYQFDPSGTGKLKYRGYHETISSPDLTFDWDISEQGNLIFSNVFFGGASISTHQIYSLSKKDTSSLEVCLFASNGSSEDEEYCSEEAWFYNREDAEEASKE